MCKKMGVFTPFEPLLQDLEGLCYQLKLKGDTFVGKK